MSNKPPDEKQFFKIGEVAGIVGVKPHVLRYWESEFPALKPMKTRGAHRMYRRGDVELACLIRRLVHEDGFTIPGAKKRIRELKREDAAPESVAVGREVALRAELLAVRAELQYALDALERPAEAAPQKAGTVTVTAVVPAVVSVPSGRR